ncbi:MAG TPA: MFS transporter [Symbiobacteriaceae bacterium]|jgi:hypothetical protein
MSRTASRPQWGPLFRNRNFTLLFSGQLVSSLGDIVYDLALLWFIFGATGSAVKTGGVMLAGMISQILFGLPAGALVDRWNRKVTMIASDLFRGAVVLSLAVVMAGSRHLPLWYVYLAGFSLHTAGMLFGPARNAVMPDIVGEELLLSANVAAGMIGQLLTVGGTALGGAVVVLLGPGLALTFDGLSFIVSAITIMAVHIPDSRRVVGGPALTVRVLLADIRAGIAFLYGQASLRFLFALVLLVNFGSLMYSALTPMLATGILHAGATGYGLINTAMVAGSLAGGLLVGPVVMRLTPRAAVTAGLAGAGAAAVLLGFVHSLTPALLLFGLMGLTLVFNQMPIYTQLQADTPGYMRGRLLNTFGVLANLVGPVAVALGTLLADRIGASGVYMAGGIVVLAGALLVVGNPGLLNRPAVQQVVAPQEPSPVRTETNQ